MTEEITKKPYPQATPEMTKLFRMGHEPANHGAAAEEMTHDLTYQSQTQAFPPGSLPVENLPVANYEGGRGHYDVHASVSESQPLAGKEKKSFLEKEALHSEPEASAKKQPWLMGLKAVLPYAAIFGIGIFLYFFFFSSVDFSKLFKVKSVPQNQRQTALMALQKANLAGYRQWIAQFYYDVSDPKIVDPETDNSGNGLSNFQKYLLNLNPKSSDTAGLGMSDSDALTKGINPLSGNNLTEQQKKIIDTYFDMETISNKQALAKLQKAGQVAGIATLGIPQASASGDFLPAYATSSGTQFGAGGSFGTASGINLESGSNTTAAAAARAAGTDAGNMPDPVFGNLDIDTSVPGRLEIPSLKVNAPVMWSASPDNFDKDLQSGVVHYPGTALPGQVSTSYISGHSSNYVWAKGSYNKVFTYLDNINNNDSFKVTVVLKNGKDAILHYLVTGKQQYKPDDIAQFQNGGKSVMALSTCWPVGSTAKRLVVFGELTQVVK